MMWFGTPLAVAATSAIMVALFGCEGPVGPEGPRGPAGAPTLTWCYQPSIEFKHLAVDTMSGMNTETGVYTVQEQGDYHVSFAVEWDDEFSTATSITCWLLINRGYYYGVSAERTVSGAESASFSKSLIDLASSDTIEVAVGIDSGPDKYVNGHGNQALTYLTILGIDGVDLPQFRGHPHCL